MNNETPLVSSVKEMKEQMLRSIYDLGQKEAIEGLSETQRDSLREIFEKHPTWEEFFEAFKSIRSPTVLGVLGKHYNKKKSGKPSTDAVKKAISTLQLSIKYSDSTAPSGLYALRRLRTELEQKCPLDTEVHDINYVKYYDCCCCGEPSPPGGHTLTFVEDKGWKYPVCDKCQEETTPLNPMRLAEMYYRYALTIEYAFDKIYG